VHQVGKKDYHYIRMHGQQNVKKLHRCKLMMKQQNSLKRRYISTKQHVITSQKMARFTGDSDCKKSGKIFFRQLLCVPQLEGENCL